MIDTQEVIVVESIVWFRDRIVFEVIREDGEDDVIEWSHTMPLLGPLDHQLYDKNRAQMNKIARRYATSAGIGERRRGRR
jgi:hypothetical protein